MFRTVRAKILCTLSVAFVLLLWGGYFALSRLAHLGDVEKARLEENLMIRSAASRVIILSYQSAEIVARSLSYEDLVDLEKLDESMGLLQGANIDLELLTLALQFGSDSSEFRSVNGGITQQLWQRRGWAELYRLPRSPPVISQLAEQTAKQNSLLEDDALRALRRLKMALHYEIQGRTEEAKKAKIEARTLVQNAFRYRAEVEKFVTELVSAAEQNLQSAIKVSTDRKKALYLQLGVGSAIVLAFLLLLGWVGLENGIVGPLHRISNALNSIASGNLNFKFNTRREDEFGSVKCAIDRMTSELASNTVSREFVNNIIQAMADTLVVVMQDSSIVRVNAATSRLLNYEESELIGKSMNLLVESDGGTEYLSEKEKKDLFANGSISDIEKVYLAKCGKKIAVLFSASLLRNKIGEIEGIVCVAQDVSERKRAQSDLVNLRAALESSEVGVSRIDSRGNYRAVDRVYTSMLSVALEDLIGSAWRGTVHGDDLAVANAAYDEMIEFGKSDFDARAVRSDGSSFYVSITLVKCFDEHGDRDGHYCFMRNVDRRMEAENEIRRARDEALHLASLKSNFLANMSHEIRTPMNGVIGMTDLLLETSLTSEQLELATAVKSSSESLLTIINDILDFSKIEVGRLELDIHPFEGRKWFNETLHGLEILASKRKQEVVKIFDPSIPSTLIGDSSRLRQVLINLVGNSIKFTPEGGGIIAKVDLVERDLNHILLGFSVSDSGRGIAKDHTTKVFDSFSQADNSISRTYGGTGLGLAIVRSLVELMGGDIWVDSALGVGSTFRFTARLGYESISDSEAKSDSIGGAAIHDLTASTANSGVGKEPDHFEAGDGVRVLLAEDNSVNQMLVKKILEKQGYEVVLAENGLEALESLRQQKFDVVLMDVQMPRMDGEEATRRIRAGNTEYSKIPIVALTAHAMKGDEEKYLAMGMDAYIAKPLKKRDLLITIQTLLSKTSVSSIE